MARSVVTEGPAVTAEITPANINDFLGVLKFREFWLEKHNEIGLATGLAWTEVGGSVLATEATIMEGKGRLTPTGKLGDVMQESAQAAMATFARAPHAFGLPQGFLPQSSTFTCTSPKAPSPRTALPPVSPFAPPSSAR